MEHRTIAILGGTGDLGSGLAKCWRKAGHKIVIGTRSVEKAKETLAAEGLLGAGLSVEDYAGATRNADIVILAVPYAVHKDVLEAIKPELGDKIIVDAVVPLVPPKVSIVQLPAAGSAAMEARAILGEGARIVSAFHNVGAKKLHDGHKADCDVLVFGDDADARNTVADLARDVATGSVEAGALANSAAAEALTSILIWLNRRHKVSAAGIKITGLPAEAVVSS